MRSNFAIRVRLCPCPNMRAHARPVHPCTQQQQARNGFKGGVYMQRCHRESFSDEGITCIIDVAELSTSVITPVSDWPDR